LPDSWEALSFKILYRGRTLKIQINKKQVSIENLEGEAMDLFLAGTKMHLEKSGSVFAMM